MSRREAAGFKNIDWMTFSLYISMMVIGWMMIYAAGYEDGDSTYSFFNLDSTVGKQAMWISFSVLILLLTTVIDWKFWRTFSYFIYAFGIILLIAVLFMGVKVKGATSWIRLGSFTIQPSEFAKFATSLAVASYLSAYNTDLRRFRHQFVSVLLFLFPVVLILLQPDAGSAIVFGGFFIVLFREGMPSILYVVLFSTVALFIMALMYDPSYVVIGLMFLGILLLINAFKEKLYYFLGFCSWSALSVLAIYYGYIQYVLGAYAITLLGFSLLHWRKGRYRLIRSLLPLIFLGSIFTYMANFGFKSLKPHQQDRINVWLAPHLCDPHGSLYNVLQSKMAIGSGGLQGKGFLEGTMTKLNYVPEQSTDFIFCTIGEEQGFIGTFGIICLFFLLLLRITILAERQRSDFSRLYAYSIAGILFVHFFVNIGMTMGLVPIIGIPLPFISYGGSSLMSFTLMIGVLLKLDANHLNN